MNSKHKASMIFMLIIAFSIPSSAEIWREHRETMPEYDLSGKKILMVLGHDYDHHEVFDIKDIWESWGAIVHVSAAEEITEGHTVVFNGVWFDSSMDSKIETDILLSDASMKLYDALYFPGGKGPEHLVEHHAETLHRLIDEALQKQATIGAICGGPFALSTHEHFMGMKMTVSPSKKSQMINYGIEYVNEVVVMENNVITGNWPFFETFAIAMAHNILYPEDGSTEIFPPFDCYMTEAIRGQRAPQGFLQKEISRETLHEIMQSGLSLPQVRFMHQDWKFIALKSPKKRALLKEKVLTNIKENDLHPNLSETQVHAYWGSILDDALLLIAFHRTAPEDLSLGRVRFMEQNIISAGAQISLKAQYLGLGTQWVNAFPAIEGPIKEVLETEEDLHLVFIMALGYPREYALPNVRKGLDRVLRIY